MFQDLQKALHIAFSNPDFGSPEWVETKLIICC